MIAIIPARGGSKGLPGKNIKMLGDKPLIAHSIVKALDCPEVERVVVTTDSEDIAAVAREYGAEVPFLRPDYLASDESSAIDAYLHCIDFLQDAKGISIDEVTILLPTAPLRRVEDITEAIRLFKSKQADSVVSYTEQNHPIEWHKHVDADFRISNIFEDSIDNRQSYRTTYYPNGSIFVFKTIMLRNRTYYTDNSFAYLMPKEFSADIDSELDFQWVEFLQIRNHEKTTSA